MNARQTAFVQFYLIDFNGTQAAIKAGYSEHTAQVTASQLLRKPMVKAAVEAGKQKLAETSTVSRDWLVEQLRTTLITAHDAKQGQVVARTAELLARMHGWIDDKPQGPQQLVNLVIQR